MGGSREALGSLCLCVEVKEMVTKSLLIRVDPAEHLPSTCMD